MSLRILTHTADRTGAACVHCGIALPIPAEKSARSILPCELIAVVESKCVPPRSYRPFSGRDTNPLCPAQESKEP